jgi:hypothetical protein
MKYFDHLDLSVVVTLFILISVAVLSGCATPSTIPQGNNLNDCYGVAVQYRTGSRIKRVQDRVHHQECSTDMAQR